MRRVHRSVQDDSELPYWIRDILSQQWYSCSQPAYVHFRQDLLRERVLQAVDGYENGREQLRRACCVYLQHDDAQVLEQSLACLFVIGLATDANAVEPLLRRPDEAIRKAARTCLFEIRRRLADDSD
jgi:hypothetical protein